jgi:hypothetical protein
MVEATVLVRKLRRLQRASYVEDVIVVGAYSRAKWFGLAGRRYSGPEPRNVPTPSRVPIGTLIPLARGTLGDRSVRESTFGEKLARKLESKASQRHERRPWFPEHRSVPQVDLLSAGYPRTVEATMRKTVFALLISAMPFSAIAQTTNLGSQDRQSVTPTSPNSGAGMPGHPGNKSGPAAKRSGTTGSDVNSGTSTQDTSKIPGKPGGKSGPAVRSPSTK